MSLPSGARGPAKSKRAALAVPLVLTGIFLALGFCSRARTNAHLGWTYVGVAAFLLCWLCFLFCRSAPKPAGYALERVVVRTHYVQALMQTSIYAYWGWYWRNVYAEIPLILSQVAFLYVFDSLVTWSRGQKWRVGFGPWPIILGTNLFIWFRDDWYLFQFLMVALGVLGKHFIRWHRDGKLTHVFNPSVFALTIFSTVMLLTGTTGHTWGETIAITEDWPPHLFILIFFCGMVVQYFFSVTLMTFAAMVAIVLVNYLYLQVTGVYFFAFTNLPVAVFLGLHLLMTDPATTPRSSLGKVIFGGLYGLGVTAAFWILEAVNQPSFYDKLVVVPFLNLLVPLLDRLAGAGMLAKIGRWETLAGPRRVNLGYMACWAAMFIVMLHTGYVEAPHPGDTLQFWEKAAAENRPKGTKNLLVLLHHIDNQDMNNPALAVTGLGAMGSVNRAQSLGALCNETGAIYSEGQLVKADPAKACHYFAQACELGEVTGCGNLAIQYLIYNRPEAEPYAKAALASLESHTSGTTNGAICFLLGYSYETGHGRGLDKTRARQLYEQGAALGEVKAMQSLAQMELTGEGGPSDKSAAARWLQKAVDAQDGPSCFYLANLYHLGDGVPQDEQRARALLEKACGLGVSSACDLLKASPK